ncbi:MAG: hypothetical protein WBQ43_03730 [Terriglobales bacterium]
MKKTILFVLLLLITVIGAGTASFAACTATTLSTAPGVWGIESYGSSPSGLDNILMQVTFVSSGTFTGTEYQSLAGTLSTFSISGTWAMGSPASDCQGTMKVTSPSTQTFNFAINNGGKGGTIVEIDAGYTQVGFMVAQGTIAKGCSSALFSKKKFSLYSYGTIPAVGGLVTATGELLFTATGTFSADPTVTLDLGAVGNLVLPATGTSSINANCTGSGVLTPTGLGQSFDVDSVVVDGGKEVLWIVTNAGDNVSGYFLE